VSTRHAARTAALQLIFQAECLADWSASTAEKFFQVFYSGKEYPELDAESQSYALSIFAGVAAHLNALNEKIESLNLGWSLVRLAKLDLAILRLALAEVSMQPSIPVKVIVDEALNLAHEFSGEQSAAFLNAALQKAFSAQLMQPEIKRKNAD
jgi:transcription antitermination protein NusB